MIVSKAGDTYTIEILTEKEMQLIFSGIKRLEVDAIRNYNLGCKYLSLGQTTQEQLDKAEAQKEEIKSFVSNFLDLFNKTKQDDE